MSNSLTDQRTINAAAEIMARYRCNKKVKWLKENGGAADYWDDLFESTREKLTQQALDELRIIEDAGYQIVRAE